MKRILFAALLAPALAFSAPWKYDQGGLTVSRSLPSGGTESRLASTLTAADGSILPADAVPLAQAQAEAYVAIDAQAGATRTKYITSVAGQEATYLLKYNDAVAYTAAAYPSASIANYPMVQAEGKALYGASPSAAQYQSAAGSIIATQIQWVAIAAAIEQQRRAGKLAVAAAATVAAVTTARDATLAALRAL